MTEKPTTKKPGTVQKLVQFPGEPEKAEIAVDDADPLYREIRIENSLKDDKGKTVKLKKNAHVDVIVEADIKDTIPDK